MNGEFTLTRILSRPLEVAAVSITVLALIILVHWAANVIFSIFAGLLLGVFLDGIARFVSDKTPIPHHLSLVILIVLIVVALVVFFWFGAAAIANQVQSLQGQIAGTVEKIQSALGTIPFLNIGKAGSNEQGGVPLSQALVQITGTTFAVFVHLGDALLMAMVGVFFAFDVEFYKRNTLLLFPRRVRQQVGSAIDATGRALCSWFLGRFIIMGTLGILTWAGLAAIKTPLAILLSIITALFSFVPFIGPIAAAFPAVLVGLSVSTHQALVTLVVYIIVQLLENNILTPLIQKYVTALPPVLLISVQLVFGALAGIAGVLLATPATVVVMVFIQALYVRDFLGEKVKVLGD